MDVWDVGTKKIRRKMEYTKGLGNDEEVCLGTRSIWRRLE